MGPLSHVHGLEPLPGRDLYGSRFARLVLDDQFDRIAGPDLGQQFAGGFGVGDGFAVDPIQAVAGLDAGPLGGRIGQDADDLQAAIVGFGPLQAKEAAGRAPIAPDYT